MVGANEGFYITAPFGSRIPLSPRTITDLHLTEFHDTSMSNGPEATSPMGLGEKDKDLAVQHFDQHSTDGQTLTGADGDGGVRKPGEDRFDHVLSPEERATALKLAMEADPGPDILSWRYMFFCFTCFIAILNSGDNGECLL